MTDHDPPVADYLLEQYALGEAAPAETETLDRRLKVDAELRARLEALRASNAEILAAHPPPEFARAVARRVRPPAAAAGSPSLRRARPFRWMLAAPAAAAVLLAIVLVKQGSAPPRGRDPARSSPRSGPALDVTREKGGPQLRVYRRAGAEVDSLRDGDVVAAGDVLQLSYVPHGRPHGVVVSLDGRRAVTLHFPAAPGQPTRLEGRGETPLPSAYELDDAPDFERFFLITSESPIDVPFVLSAARGLARSERARLDPLRLPSSLEQASFLVRKKGSQP